jgi:peptidase inhibitor I9
VGLFSQRINLTYYRSILKPGVDLSAHIDKVSNAALSFNGTNTINVKYTYNTSESTARRSFMPLTQTGKALNGYCAKLTGAALDAVRSDPTVEYMEEDSILLIDEESTRSLTTDPGARALDGVGPSIRRAGNSDDEYSLGKGVDIYVVGETHSYAG